MSGSLFIVAAPSGAGKTSLVQALVKQQANVCLSVSHTTRPPRSGEVDGLDYHFVDEKVFREMQSAGAFLESAQVFDNFYGTAAVAVHQQLLQDQDVVLEIDWQGAQQVRQNFANSHSIFILPPSKATLEQRLRNRGLDDEATISRRMRDAEREISHYEEFDYLVINDDFATALASLTAIITATRHQRVLQTQKYRALLAELLA